MSRLDEGGRLVKTSRGVMAELFKLWSETIVSNVHYMEDVMRCCSPSRCRPRCVSVFVRAVATCCGGGKYEEFRRIIGIRITG